MITNRYINKRVKFDELSEYLKKGFVKGYTRKNKLLKGEVL